jgi:hypothetical protein
MPPTEGVQEGLISAWGEQLFALVTPDGRVRTYDTGGSRPGAATAVAVRRDRADRTLRPCPQ